MTKTAEAKISQAGMDCLVAAPGYRVGTIVPMWKDTYVELSDAGMVGANGGLTRKGSILAQRLQREEEDRLFPL